MSLKESWDSICSDNILFRNFFAFLIGYAYLINMLNALDSFILIFLMVTFFAFNYRYFQLIQQDEKMSSM